MTTAIHRRLSAALLALLLLVPGPAADAEKVRIEVEGLERDLERNVRAILSLDEARGDDDLTEDRIRRLHDRAQEEIELALQPFGYYRPTLQSTLERDGDTWVARYVVDPGPPLQVQTRDLRVEGEGADDPAIQEIVREFPLEQGETLYHPDYEEGKAAFDDYAARNGYLDAAFDVSEIRVDLANYTSDVVLHYDTGPRYRFGPVLFHQNFLDPDLLRGYVTFEEGEPLNVDEVLEMQNALSDSPYFERVEVVPRTEQREGLTVPIDVNLTPSKKQRWTTGVGYGTDTGPRGTVGLELRRINRRGHRGRAEARISEIERSFQSSYEVPGPYPRTDVLSYNVGYREEITDDIESESILVGASLSQARGDWREAFSLNLQREDFVVGELDRGRAELILPQASWSRVEADDRIFTTKGHRLQFEFRGTDDAIGSNVSLVQAEAEGKLIRSFSDNFRFISRAQVGWTQTDQFRSLPASLRFFGGGDQSVRGYGYQELGRRVCFSVEGEELEGDDCDGAAETFNIGGEALLTGSVEVEYQFLEEWRFLKKWGVAAFYDTGNAFESFSGDLESGAGVGLRWLSPIGPIRADVAWALTEEGTPVRFHLTVGPDL
ncbi:MAG TPA: autotransporter assembly complex family protein [Thermoanaerobaculia bacterium]|nr:autotransporter assembly complex family protein [Thermoanaerobaculia bacterium]